MNLYITFTALLNVNTASLQYSSTDNAKTNMIYHLIISPSLSLSPSVCLCSHGLGLV